jgi:hypothetical protein
MSKHGSVLPTETCHSWDLFCGRHEQASTIEVTSECHQKASVRHVLALTVAASELQNFTALHYVPAARSAEKSIGYISWPSQQR